ncbi:MAG: hypothetical protein HKN47_00690 [Pirellulaceae bacterium]|nr:hypothetical protein [Pirellulaceae bacterium]
MRRILNRIFLPSSLFVVAIVICHASLRAQEFRGAEASVRSSDEGIVFQLMNRDSQADSQESLRSPRVFEAATNEMRSSRRTQSQVDPVAAPVRQMTYETNDRQQDDWQRLLDGNATATDRIASLDTDNRSFIEKERTSQAAEKEDAREFITKIGINLIFVLALAFGFILLAKHWQRSKFSAAVSTTSQATVLNVKQVLPLANGATLHVVEGYRNRVLVAIDTTGIRSVNVLSQTFDETMDDIQDYDTYADLANRQTRLHETSRRDSRSRSARAPEPIVHDESTAEIDEKLIALLLQKSKNAA